MLTSRILCVSEVNVCGISNNAHWLSGVNYDANIEDAGGDGCDRLIIPARKFLTSGNLASLAKSKPTPAVADGDHCREMAGKLRELALYTRSPGTRREMVDLAKRYDRRADHFDLRSRRKI